MNLQYLGEKWPSGLVSREEVGSFTGGTICPKTMANLDSTGQGPEGAIRIGRKIAYPVTSLIMWLEARSNPRDESHKCSSCSCGEGHRN